jgi:uncharacterized membrane protein YdjX (TVP38/TMEM64 family)
MERATGAAAPRRARRLRWAAIAAVAVVLVGAARWLPLGPFLAAVRGWVAGLGRWGPVVFVLIDALAVLAMVPGSLLTLAAGALFGPFVGTVTALTGSTLGAALAFAVARRLARGWVERALRGDARFEAIDRAIAAGGWKVVALLRLSPAVPFNLQNYAYGLTGIRFWPCVLSTAVAMLPATFLYASLGHAGLDAVSGGRRARTPAEWALLVVGLIATVAATVLITRLARKALGGHRDRPTETPGG